MEGHFHTGLDFFLFVGMSALVFRAFWVMIAAWMVRQGGILEHLGSAAGALA